MANVNANRIYFKNNPWPEGHPIESFNWKASVRDGNVWFDFHLETDKYYAERDIETSEDEDEYLSDWQHPGAWDNFHAATISSSHWHQGGFPVCSVDEYSPAFLDGLTLSVDPDPDALLDWEDFAFGAYILGHDSVAMHTIRFERVGNASLFNIHWTGKIALTYSGSYEYQYDFTAMIPQLEFPLLTDKD